MFPTGTGAAGCFSDDAPAANIFQSRNFPFSKQESGCFYGSNHQHPFPTQNDDAQLLHHRQHHRSEHLVLHQSRPPPQPEAPPPLGDFFCIEKGRGAAAETKKMGAAAAAATPRKRSVKRDRHSKINTAQGPRDRRMRLSLDIARRFFDLQDMLGFDKPSKTVEWLLVNSRAAIEQLSSSFHVDHAGSSSTSQQQQQHPPQSFVTADAAAAKSASSTNECANKLSAAAAGVKERRTRLRALRKTAPMPGRESRERARARARERAREKRAWGGRSMQLQVEGSSNSKPANGGATAMAEDSGGTLSPNANYHNNNSNDDNNNSNNNNMRPNSSAEVDQPVGANGEDFFSGVDQSLGKWRPSSPAAIFNYQQQQQQQEEENHVEDDAAGNMSNVEVSSNGKFLGLPESWGTLPHGSTETVSNICTEASSMHSLMSSFQEGLVMPNFSNNFHMMMMTSTPSSQFGNGTNSLQYFADHFQFYGKPSWD